jgi:Flp pilus assembly protein TadG
MSMRSGEARRSERRGGALTYFALALPVIGGFGALGIEFVYLNAVERELQGVADAAAHAALLQLDNTAAGMTAGVADAQDLVAGMHVNGQGYALDAADVEFGYFDASTGAFTVSADPVEVNAVRVAPTEEDVGLGFGLAFLGQAFPVSTCAVVVQGDGNATTEDPGGPGLANGHFDMDTVAAREDCEASAVCASTTVHTHEYDDNYGVTSADLFDDLAGQLPINGCTKTKSGSAGPCTSSGYTPVITDSQTFKLVVANADLSPGAWLTVNGVDIDVTDYDDQTFASLPTYVLGTIPATNKLTELRMNFDVDAIANCELLPTSTGKVRSNTPGIDNEWRSGSLTVQAVTTTATLSTGRSAGDQDVAISENDGLLWEAIFFWHWDGSAYTVATATAWQEEYDALDCDLPTYVDATPTPGEGPCQ